MKKVSAIISNVIGDFGPTLSLNVAIKKAWNEIVCEELRDVSSLIEAKYSGKNELSVIIKILSSAALIAKYNEDAIINNLKNITGISKIKLLFKHTNSIIKEIKSSEIIVQKIVKPKEKIDIFFENESLKNALETLKTEMQDAA